MDISPYIGYVVTAVITFITLYVATKNSNNQKFEELKVQIATLSQQVADLRADVEKHNNVIERTFKLESDMKTAYKHIDRLRDQDEKIAEHIEKLHG